MGHCRPSTPDAPRVGGLPYIGRVGFGKWRHPNPSDGFERKREWTRKVRHEGWKIGAWQGRERNIRLNSEFSDRRITSHLTTTKLHHWAMWSPHPYTTKIRISFGWLILRSRLFTNPKLNAWTLKLGKTTVNTLTLRKRSKWWLNQKLNTQTVTTPNYGVPFISAKLHCILYNIKFHENLKNSSVNNKWGCLLIPKEAIANQPRRVPCPYIFYIYIHILPLPLPLCVSIMNWEYIVECGVYLLFSYKLHLSGSMEINGFESSIRTLN